MAKNRVFEIRIIKKDSGPTEVVIMREAGPVSRYTPNRQRLDALDLALRYGDAADKVWFMTYPEMLIVHATWRQL